MPDEPIVGAVHRRLRDELATTADAVDLILPRFRYRAVMHNGVIENELCPVFLAYADSPVAPDPAEVDDARWLPWPAYVRATLAPEPGREISPWCHDQVTELTRLGDDPRLWPVAGSAELPAAARGA